MALRGRLNPAVSPASSPRRIRIAVAVALAVASLYATPGQAAAPKPLVLRAKSTASVDVTFTRAVTIDPDAVRVSGGRNYAGYYLHPLSGPLLNGTGALFLHGYRVPSAPHVKWLPMPVGLGDFSQTFPRTIPAGRYRVYVLADAPVEVRVPVTGYTARTIQATRSVRVTYVGKDVTNDVLPRPGGMASPGIVSAALPITIPSNSNVTLTTIQVISHGTFYTHHQMQPASCIGRPGVVEPDFTSCRDEQRDGQGAGFHRGQYTFASAPPSTGNFEDETNSVYFPGRLSAGPKVAHYMVGQTSVIDRVFVAALSIGL